MNTLFNITLIACGVFCVLALLVSCCVAWLLCVHFKESDPYDEEEL